MAAEIYINSNSDFYKTYTVYRNYIGYKKPYSYNRWMRLPDNQKACALYCQFYREITLAWYKVKNTHTPEADGVAEVIKYLEKNCEKIKKDKKRFKPQYIYRVAWNCLYCLCIDPNKNNIIHQNEVPDTFEFNDDSDSCVSWFDYNVPDFDFIETKSKDIITDLFHSVNDSTEVFIQYQLGEISERSAFLKWKKLGIAEGNSNDKALVSDFVNNMCNQYCKTFRKILAN